MDFTDIFTEANAKSSDMKKAEKGISNSKLQSEVSNNLGDIEEIVPENNGEKGEFKKMNIGECCEDNVVYLPLALHDPNEPNNNDSETTFTVCPNCGADIYCGIQNCPQCGAIVTQNLRKAVLDTVEDCNKAETKVNEIMDAYTEEDSDGEYYKLAFKPEFDEEDGSKESLLGVVDKEHSVMDELPNESDKEDIEYALKKYGDETFGSHNNNICLKFLVRDIDGVRKVLDFLGLKDMFSLFENIDNVRKQKELNRFKETVGVICDKTSYRLLS